MRDVPFRKMREDRVATCIVELLRRREKEY
jgi:hypothetical protein